MDLEKRINDNRWTICAKTNLSLPYTIMGIAHSPVRENCIVLFAKLPDEVEHLPMPRRIKMLDALGVDEQEDAYPIILMNKVYGSRSMREMNMYSFYRNFRRTVEKTGIDIKNIHSARHLIGKKISSKFVQMRKLNTDIKFWAVDRVGLTLA